MSYKKCAKLLSEQDDILLLTHKNPDGDCMGSAAALCSALRRLGKRAFLYRNPQISKKLQPFVEGFLAPADFAPRFTVSVDVAAERMFPQGFAGQVDCAIDHHPRDGVFAAYTLTRPELAACAQLVLKLIKTLGLELTAEEADLLYIGLSTDCGCFRYNNTDAAALEAGAELVRRGARNFELNQLFFNKLSPARMKLEGLIYESMGFYREGALVVGLVTREMLRKAGADVEECDDLAAIVNRAAGSRMSVTITELSDGSSKVSVRSAPGLSARAVCAAFGGGGHEQAAGCIMEKKPEEARKLLLAVIDEVWK